jgi:hypothetical protein
VAGFIIDFTFPDGSAIEIDGNKVKYWILCGLPDYEGSLEGFANAFPKHMGVLIANHVVIVKET